MGSLGSFISSIVLNRLKSKKGQLNAARKGDWKEYGKLKKEYGTEKENTRRKAIGYLQNKVGSFF